MRQKVTYTLPLKTDSKTIKANFKKHPMVNL